MRPSSTSTVGDTERWGFSKSHYGSMGRTVYLHLIDVYWLSHRTYKIHVRHIFTYMNGWFLWVNVGKYTVRPMNPMGDGFFDLGHSWFWCMWKSHLGSMQFLVRAWWHPYIEDMFSQCEVQTKDTTWPHPWKSFQVSFFHTIVLPLKGSQISNVSLVERYG